MSDEFDDAQPGAKRRGILIGVLLVGVLALGTAAWFARPVYRHFKETRNLKLSREFFEKGDLRNGVLSLRAAIAANPNNLEATRKMAELLGEAQSPAALGWWRRVVELSPTTEHRVLLAAAALRLEKPPFQTVTNTLDDLEKSGAETNVAFHLVASQLALRLNQLDPAVTHLAAAVALEPTNRLHQLNLATLHLRHTNSMVADQARQELEALIADPVLGEHALRSLIAHSLLKKQHAEAERYSGQLLALPKARFDDRLQHLTVLESAGSAQTNQWLQQLKTEAVTNVARVTLLANWMATHGQPRAAIDWLASLDAQVRAGQALALVQTDCFLLLKDWAGLEQFLTGQNWEEQEAMRLALLTRALREQGRRDVADAQWKRALAAPGSKGEGLGAIAQLAASWGWKQESEEALWALVKRAPWQDGAWQALIRARTDAGDTAGLYRVYSSMLESKPNAVGIKNNVAAIGLLLNRDIEKCSRMAREVYLAATNNSTFVSTHAYALHLAGQSAEALRLLQDLPEQELQRPAIAVYYAVLLAANGQRDKAASFAALAEKEQLLPEEKRLLTEISARK